MQTRFDRYYWSFGIVFLLSLYGCSSGKITRDPMNDEAKAIPKPVIPTDPVELKVYEQAKTFDAFLKKELKPDQLTALRTLCEKTPSENIFCYGVTQFDSLEEKRRANIFRVNSRRKTGKQAKFRIKGGKVTNWKELTAAKLSSLIRAIHTLRPADAKLVMTTAMEETSCPNPVAIASAVQQEDNLPNDVKMEQLGTLYQRGGECLGANDPDREALLTRAGLFFFAAKDYKAALIAFDKASKVENTFVGRTLYWSHRANLELNQKDAAAKDLEAMKTRYPFAFHTLMALNSNGQDPGIILSKTNPDLIRRSNASPAINPLIDQVELLSRYGFEQAAGKVLDWAVASAQGVEPEIMVYLAELKKEQGDYRSKITILTDVLYKRPDLISKETMELYFPKVYFPIFEKQSNGVDPYLLLAVARRESAFNPKATSPANARGLLQMLPATSRLLKKKANLFDPETNIELGAKYLTQLLQKSDGKIHLALASYNAGPNRVTVWTDRYPVTEPILFMDLIPYRETREYVASVLRNYYWYRRIHSGEENLDSKQLLHIAITHP